jgi:hypothetical protein
MNIEDFDLKDKVKALQIDSLSGTWSMRVDRDTTRDTLILLVPAPGSYTMTPINEAGAPMFHEGTGTEIKMPLQIPPDEWSKTRPEPGTSRVFVQGIQASYRTSGTGGVEFNIGADSYEYTSPKAAGGDLDALAVLLQGLVEMLPPIIESWSGPQGVPWDPTGPATPPLPFPGPQETPPVEGEEALWEPTWDYFAFDHTSYLPEGDRSALLRTADVTMEPTAAQMDWRVWFQDFEEATKEDRAEILQSVTPRMNKYLFLKGGLARVWAAHLLDEGGLPPREAWAVACDKTRPLITSFQTLGEHVGDIVILYAHHPDKIPNDMLG